MGCSAVLPGGAGILVALANLISAGIAGSVDAASQKGLYANGWLGMAFSVPILVTSIAILLGSWRGPAFLLLVLGLSATLSALPYMLFSGLAAVVGGTMVTLVQHVSNRERRLG